MSGAIQLDETGLHSVDCQCIRCEAGFRPSEMQRHYARQRLVQVRIEEEGVHRPSREELRRRDRRERRERERQKIRAEEVQWRREHPPLSEEQVRQLEETKRRMYPALAGGSRR
jgi:hypothetical protein